MRDILAVDDNKLNIKVATRALKDFEFEIDECYDGQECLDKINSGNTYDLILMDVQMPHMDVYKATQTIRQLSNRDKTTIPITALTANAFEEDRKKAVAQGMNGHISKPIDVDKIEKVLLSILK